MRFPTCVVCLRVQVMIQSGQPPTVLQQVCSLPFQYFSDPRLVAVLFPALICCCYDNHSNTDILEQELSSALLANFIEVGRLIILLFLFYSLSSFSAFSFVSHSDSPNSFFGCLYSLC